jgi:hypothetical protein
MESILLPAATLRMVIMMLSSTESKSARGGQVTGTKPTGFLESLHHALQLGATSRVEDLDEHVEDRKCARSYR